MNIKIDNRYLSMPRAALRDARKSAYAALQASYTAICTALHATR